MQSFEEKPMDENAIKKNDLIYEINFAKNNLSIWRRTPESIRTAEAMLKKIKGDVLDLEDQFKLYQSIAKFKPKSAIMELFEKMIIGALTAKHYTKSMRGVTSEDYLQNLNALLDAEAIPDAITFKKILEKDPLALKSAIESVNVDWSLNQKEMLQWLAQVENPESVTKTMTRLKFGRNARLYENSPLKGKYIQILSKISDYNIGDLARTQLIALHALATSYRPLSALSPEFIIRVLEVELLESKDPRDLIAQDFIDNPHKIQKIRLAIPDQYWTKDNLKEILNVSNGLLLSEEAEQKLWDNIPKGHCKGELYDKIITTSSAIEDDYFEELNRDLSQIRENQISPTISAEIKNYESKRWFWERWFFKLPEPIVKAKEILNSGTGTYKNLDIEKQFELLRCLNEATKKDKRSSDVLAVFEGALRFKYESNDPNYKDFETILTMVKEGIIDNPKKFEVATQKAQHWVSECYKQFNEKKTDMDLRDVIWPLIFEHPKPEEFAQALSQLAGRNALDYEQLASIQASADPLTAAKKSIQDLDEPAQPKVEHKEKALEDEDSVIDITELGKQPPQTEVGQARQKPWPPTKEQQSQPSSKTDSNKPKTSWAKRKSLSEPPEEPKTPFSKPK